MSHSRICISKINYPFNYLFKYRISAVLERFLIDAKYFNTSFNDAFTDQRVNSSFHINNLVCVTNHSERKSMCQPPIISASEMNAAIALEQMNDNIIPDQEEFSISMQQNIVNGQSLLPVNANETCTVDNFELPATNCDATTFQDDEQAIASSNLMECEQLTEDSAKMNVVFPNFSNVVARGYRSYSFTLTPQLLQRFCLEWSPIVRQPSINLPQLFNKSIQIVRSNFEPIHIISAISF